MLSRTVGEIKAGPNEAWAAIPFIGLAALLAAAAAPLWGQPYEGLLFGGLFFASGYPIVRYRMILLGAPLWILL